MADRTPKGRVFVVDDNRDAADTMSQLLTMAGFEVETYYDGRTALAAAGSARPDACVLDINMPGMSGYELAGRLRALFPDRPPVFATMTAYGDYAHLERAVDAGFDLQFTKPADATEVAEQLEAHVRRQARPAEAREADRRSLFRRLLDRVNEVLARPAPAPG